MVTRVEVYGLFLATVLLGGGAAVAMTDSSTIDVSSTQPTPVATTQEVVSTSTVEQPVSQQELGEGPVHVIETEIRNGVEFPVGAPTAFPVPPPEPEKIASPFIGDAASVFYEGRNHICGWDYQALGGWGWGLDPNMPCNADFINYIATHCSANDGVVYVQRCNEWSTGTLPVAN